MRKAPFFSEWLQKQTDRKDPTGELARTVGTRVPKSDDRKDLRKKVESLVPEDQGGKAFDVAWRMFRS
jgi:hypothetical protein